MEQHIQVCLGKTCKTLGSETLYNFLEFQIKKHDCPVLKVSDSVDLKIQLCNKYCENGPLIRWNNKLFVDMDETKSEKLIQAVYEHNDEMIEELKPIMLDQDDS